MSKEAVIEKIGKPEKISLVKIENNVKYEVWTYNQSILRIEYETRHSFGLPKKDFQIYMIKTKIYFLYFKDNILTKWEVEFKSRQV
jgi:hypothetical protein